MSKAVLIISIACLMFLLSLQVLYYISYSNQIIQIFGELFTIPTMAFVVFAFFFSLIKVLKKNKEYNLVLGINIFTILISVAATAFLD